MHAARRVDGPHHGPQTLPVSKKSDTDLSDTGAVAALSNWDPMAFDYHSKSFNSYVVGPGRTLSTMASGKKPCENALLYITNIPHTLTRQGLMNACAKVQPRIISLDNKVRNPRNGYTRAVVAYRTIREAQDVMLALHMAEPLRLRVTFGQSIESRVNEASLRLHAKILKQRKEEEERRRAALATPYDFQPLVLNPGDLLGTDTRLELLDFAEDYYFSWKFQTGRGIFFPPRQPYLSWALKPLGTEVEHFRATMDLDVNRSRDQEFDVFGHFDLGLFDETTAVVAMVYEKHLKESGMGPRKIFGGRAFDPPAPFEPSEVNCFEEEEDPLHEIVVGGSILNEGKIGPEGKINVCMVCGGVTQSCCSTCFLPFCSRKCAEEHQGNHEDQGCGAL